MPRSHRRGRVGTAEPARVIRSHRAGPRTTGTLGRVISAVAAVAGLIGGGAVVWQASYAAFSATTVNPGSSWSAGNVVMTDDDGGGAAAGTALFNATGLLPGNTGTKCIRVTYNGNVNAPVRLYATNPTGSLGQYLDLTVEDGTGGTFADCTGFVAAGFIYSTTQPVASAGTLGDLVTTRTSHATGLGSWSPSAAATNRTFRFTYTLQDNVGAMNQSATATFVWEARA